MIRKTNHGFTIVELLIVIVIIAILAAITIVAYTGIQNKAHDVATQSNIRQILTGLEIMYSETNGYYMVENAESSTHEVCIGESPNGVSSCGETVIAGSGCSALGITPASAPSPINYSSGFNQELKKYIGTVPRGVQSKSYTLIQKHNTQDCTATKSVSGAIYRTAKEIDVYTKSDGSVGSIAYNNSASSQGAGAFSITYSANEGQCKVPNSLLGVAKGTILQGDWSITTDAAMCYVFVGDVSYIQA